MAARRREVDGIVVWRLDSWVWSVSDLMATLRGLIRALQVVLAECLAQEE
jgi:hypothetical protein